MIRMFRILVVYLVDLASYFHLRSYPSIAHAAQGVLEVPSRPYIPLGEITSRKKHLQSTRRACGRFNFLFATALTPIDRPCCLMVVC